MDMNVDGVHAAAKTFQDTADRTHVAIAGIANDFGAAVAGRDYADLGNEIHYQLAAYKDALDTWATAAAACAATLAHHAEGVRATEDSTKAHIDRLMWKLS